MPANGSQGSLEKLKILGYSDEKYGSKVGEYVVQINPEKYSQQYSIQVSSKPTLNTAGETIKFVVQKPQDLSLEFYIDGSGVVDASISSSTVTQVEDELEKFRKVVYDYNGSVHSPNYLRLLWGKLIFNCRLVSLDIEYLLFTPAGVPLRAKLNAKFSEFLSPEKMQLEAKQSSPDLTHSRTVVAGDTLPLLCFQIYKDSKYYVEIARFNGLEDFRNLPPGQKIYFPPLGD